jgi:hypothetical protein
MGHKYYRAPPKYEQYVHPIYIINTTYQVQPLKVKSWFLEPNNHLKFQQFYHYILCLNSTL